MGCRGNDRKAASRVSVDYVPAIAYKLTRRPPSSKLLQLSEIGYRYTLFIQGLLFQTVVARTLTDIDIIVPPYEIEGNVRGCISKKTSTQVAAIPSRFTELSMTSRVP